MIGFFPFKIKYEKEIFTSEDLEKIFGTIKAIIIEESPREIKIIVNDNSLIYKVGFIKNIFFCVEKGIFKVNYDEPSVKLIYNIYTLRFFLVTSLLFSLIQIGFNRPYMSWYFGLFVVELMLWLGTVISHKFFFDRIVKRLEEIK
jgi:hypothetical protein